MAHIAIIHFTAGGVPGGIERIIDAQVACLSDAGHSVRVIAGAGIPLPGTITHFVSELDPGSATEVPPVTVAALADRLNVLLLDCDQCWVHNVFTVTLNPLLTAALCDLVARERDRRWLAWCEDISANSAYAEAIGEAASVSPMPVAPNLRHVTISMSRRKELAEYLGIEESDIEVVLPPLDVARWLEFGLESRLLIERAEALKSDVCVLVVAKLLPHKNLVRAVAVADMLRTFCNRAFVCITGASSVHQPELSRRVGDVLRREIDSLGLRTNVWIMAGELDMAPRPATVRDFIQFADVLFVPSTEEGYGLPIVEAIACRLPVVCFDLPALREAGGVAATYLPLDASDAEIATVIWRVAQDPVNKRRREVWRSIARFNDEILGLAGLTPGETREGQCPPSQRDVG